MSAVTTALVARGSRSTGVRHIVTPTFDDIVQSFEPNVVSYWKFQDPVGGIVTDEEGQENAMITGAPELDIPTIVKFDTISAGASTDGTCIAWPGTAGDYAEAAHDAAHKTAAGTIVVHFQRDSAVEKSQLVQADSPTTAGMAIGVLGNNNGAPDAYIRDGGGTAIPLTGGFGDVQLDRAYTVIFKWGSGGGMRLALYDDTGTLVRFATNPSAIGLSGNTAPIRFGATHGAAGEEANHHDGPYGRVIWMNRRLTDVEEVSLAQALSIARSAGPYRALVLGMSPLALWGLGEATGSQFFNAVGGTPPLHGTFAGAVLYKAMDLPQDSIGGAINFAGTGSGSVPFSGLSLPVFSLSFWFRTDSVPSEGVTAAPLITKSADPSGPGDFACSLGSNGVNSLRVRFRDATNGIVDIATDTGSIQNSITYHVCIRGDATGVDLYLDGVFIGKDTTITTGWSNNSQDLRFATGLNFTATANCVLDEVCLFPRLISVNEVIALAQRSGIPPVAVGGPVIVPENGTWVLNVLANDTYVGTPTIQVMSGPGGGDTATAVPATNTATAYISYVAGDVTEDTVRTFNYRVIDPNGTSNTVTVSVTIQADDFVAVSNANCFTIQNPPTATVTTIAALVAAVNNANPGDQIAIDGGTHAGGTHTFTAAGTAANPIVIRPVTGEVVTITNAVWTLAGSSARLVIYGLNFVGGGARSGRETTTATIQVNGSHNRISRCQFRQINAATVRMHAATDTRVDHCDFADYLSNTNFYKRCVTLDNLSIRNGTCRRTLIDRCHFHDLLQNATGPGGDTWSNVIEPGGSGGAINHNAQTIVEYCLLERIERFGSNEVIVIKGCGVTIRYCTFVDMGLVHPGQHVQERDGSGLEIRSCFFQNTGSNRPASLFDRFSMRSIAGRPPIIIGCRMMGSGGIYLGCTSGNVNDPDDYPGCNGARVIGNHLGSGNIIVGGQISTTFVSNAVNNILQGNTRDTGADGASMVDVQHATGTVMNPQAIDAQYLPFDEAVELSPSDVGLNAPDPLCPLPSPQSR